MFPQPFNASFYTSEFWDQWYYCIPLLPIAVYMISIYFYVDSYFIKLCKMLPKGVKERESHRALFLPMAGFSFTVVVALALVNQEFFQEKLNIPLYFVVISFLSYLLALNIQSYKDYNWQDLLGNVMNETGQFCLLATIVSLIVHFGSDLTLKIILSFFALIIWSVDFIMRLTIDLSVLNNTPTGERNE